MGKKATSHPTALTPYLSEIGAWAFSIGCSIGWGSFVVTSSSYLRRAGIWGSIAGLLIGAIIMVVIARNYHYMINCFPDSGGVYTYAKEVFGFDHGFLSAWFLFLTYIAVFWANVTSLPLFVNYFSGGVFKVGLRYTVFGYDVYIGEALVSVVAIILTTLFCIWWRRAAMQAMIGMALFFCVGIIGVYAACLISSGTHIWSPDPGFVPEASAIGRTLLVATISPWAFIGFENISHMADEYTFSRTKTFKIMLVSVIMTTVLYCVVMLMSTVVYPERYSNWLVYISDLDNLSGLEALPAFYAANALMGQQGVTILMLSLLCLIVTSLIGNMVALSRLLFSMAKDDVLPKSIAKVNRKGSPYRALALVGIISLAVPFIGRTAIGWIVDVTTIGATIIYGIVSAAAFSVARARKNPVERVTGLIGVIAMVIFGMHALLSGIFESHSMEPETYFLFAAWGLVGFIAFRLIMARDSRKRFGRSTIVWVGLQALIVFAGFAWMNQTLINVEHRTRFRLASQYSVRQETADIVAANRDMIKTQMDNMDSQRMFVIAVGSLLFVVALLLLVTNYSHVSRWALESDEKLSKTRNSVYTNPLTGLQSMARFVETAPAIEKQIAASGNSAVVLAFVIAGLKDYTESHGSDSENRILRSFANILSETFGKEASAHAFDNSFYAISPISVAEERVKGLFAGCSAAPELGELPIHAGAYSCIEGDDISTDGIRRAQRACATETKEWEHQLHWYDEKKTEAAKLRSYILRNVDKAIANRWIRPYYQAEVDAKTREVCGKEALARWIDPEMGFLSPAEFIPTLEEAGLLYKLDMHMVDCVLGDFTEMKARGIPSVPASINISQSDLEKMDVISEIAAKVDKAGIDRSMLRIEITESVAVSDAETLKKLIAGMHEERFEVWMDDFGSGYSSLNSLKEFDFDVLKLDMGLISDESNPKTWDIVKGVITMGRQIGMRILAEGVETESQADMLRDAGCDILQGFFFSKPLPIDEIAEYFKKEDGDS